MAVKISPLLPEFGLLVLFINVAAPYEFNAE
jgi:hypothetical protein